MINEILRSIIVGATGSYNMFSLEIKIEGKTNFERNPTVFHEYTHYLQNTTTINGFIVLDKYIHVFLRCFTKLGSSPTNPNIPLCDYHELQATLGDKNIENISKCRLFGMEYNASANKYIFDNTDLDDYTITECEHLDHYSGIILKIPYIAIDGENIPLNETVIKENMAFVNSIIGNKQNDKLTRNDINEILSFRYKEYNVLFDFINHYLPDCNLLKLVYCICEISLNVCLSEQIIGNILLLIQNEFEEMSKFETDKIIYLISEAINYDKIFSIQISTIQEKAIKKTIELFNIFDISDNQFVGILKKFYDFLIAGIELRSKQKTLYVERLTDNYIQSLTSVVGCPIIYFAEENEYRNLSKTPEYFFNDFVYLHAALKIFMNLYISNITLCPFLESNICQVQKNELCRLNCLLNYCNDNYKNCLLSNALICTGIRQKNRNI